MSRVSGQEAAQSSSASGQLTVWVLDFVEERFHNMSPGDFDSIFIKAGDSETREDLG